VDELPPQIARQIGVPARGDVIQEPNRKSVKNVAKFESAERRAGREAVLLLVNRAGTTLFPVVEPV
jgi:hypothetical protein